jgi:hypothetical protein
LQDFPCSLRGRDTMTSTKLNQALRAIEISTVLISGLVVIIGVGVTGPA